jgi:hypothetical protein
MEISTGLIIFFVLTTIVGVAIGLIFSVEDLGKKIEQYFKEDKKD